MSEGSVGREEIEFLTVRSWLDFLYTSQGQGFYTRRSECIARRALGYIVVRPQGELWCWITLSNAKETLDVEVPERDQVAIATGRLRIIEGDVVQFSETEGSLVTR